MSQEFQAQAQPAQNEVDQSLSQGPRQGDGCGRHLRLREAEEPTGQIRSPTCAANRARHAARGGDQGQTASALPKEPHEGRQALGEDKSAEGDRAEHRSDRSRSVQATAEDEYCREGYAEATKAGAAEEEVSEYKGCLSDVIWTGFRAQENRFIDVTMPMLQVLLKLKQGVRFNRACITQGYCARGSVGSACDSYHSSCCFLVRFAVRISSSSSIVTFPSLSKSNMSRSFWISLGVYCSFRPTLIAC